jgi:hypothetical protein
MTEKKDYKNISNKKKAKELALVKEALSKVNNELKINNDTKTGIICSIPFI